MRRLALLAPLVLLVAWCSAAAPSGAPATTPSPATTPMPSPPPTSSAPAETAPPPDPDAVAEVAALRREIGWKDDLHSLVTRLERIHPNPYWRISEAEFDTMVDFLWSDVPRKTDDEIVAAVARIMATIDGHSGLFPWTLGWDLAHIHLYRFEEGVTVVRAEDPRFVGATVVSVGDTPIGEAWEAAAALSPHDNPASTELVTAAQLIVPRVLAALGIITDPGALSYTLALADGSTVVYTPTVSTADERDAEFGPGLAGLPGSDRARYLARRDEPFWWTVLGDGTTYAQYNSVTTTAFGLPDLTEAIAGGNGRLIIDLRHNGGGDNGTYRSLLDEIVAAYGQRCGLFVLIGRATFSAAMNFATELDLATTAVFVGEPTGGSPNLYGDTEPVRLPNSGLVVRVSAVYWEIAGPADHRVWIEPDIPVAPTAADYFSGRDPALEAALSAPLCGPEA